MSALASENKTDEQSRESENMHVEENTLFDDSVSILLYKMISELIFSLHGSTVGNTEVMIK